MSSSMNFHGVRNFKMEAFDGGGIWTVDFTVQGDLGHDHRLTSFARQEDFPHFERAVKAFNDALVDFVPQPLPGEEPTSTEEIPF